MPLLDKNAIVVLLVGNTNSFSDYQVFVKRYAKPVWLVCGLTSIGYAW